MAITVERAQKELAALALEQKSVESRLQLLHDEAFATCHSNLHLITSETTLEFPELLQTLSETREVSDQLCQRVRQLDLVNGRIQICLSNVDDLLDLRNFSELVERLVQNQDYEQAAKCIKKYKSVSQEVRESCDDGVCPKLEKAEKELGVIVREKFGRAIASGDGANVSRFAKLFFPLGLEREGLKRYITFIRGSLEDKANLNFRNLSGALVGQAASDQALAYAKTLEQLMVAIAEQIQEHQQNIRQDFGAANFLLVLRGLHEEVDIQGMKIMDKFRSDFPDNGQYSVDRMDQILHEMVMLSQRAQQFDAYLRVLAKDLKDQLTDSEDLEGMMTMEHGEDGLVVNSELMRGIQEMIGSYVLFEQKFITMQLEKAASQEQVFTDDPDSFTSTYVDDSFFVLQTSICRACASCDLPAVCAVVNNAVEACGRELKSTLDRNLKKSQNNYKSFVNSMEHLRSGNLQALWADEKELVTSSHSWPHALNNLATAVEYVDKLKEAALETFGEFFPDAGIDASRRDMFHQCLSTFDAAREEFGLLFNQQCRIGVHMLKPHFGASLVRPLEAMDFNINEHKFEDYQVNDPYVKNLCSLIVTIHTHLRNVLIETCVQGLLLELAEQIASRIERTMMEKKMSAYGALQFDQDVRQLVTFFTNEASMRSRHKFSRLSEMGTLLNLDKVEWLRDIWDHQTWHLTNVEIRKILLLRTDFTARMIEDEVGHLLPVAHVS
eukprot:GEMP01015483.1.p1 GENE.GEMP01015483.1~~GEMP01015483.1.p1  ORF type:complete len:725 (+),score=188.20 GEMP01015483.1:96-2270(+)